MRIVHFKDFFGPGALCFEDAAPEARTPIPERVTCPRCLALMGRSGWALEPEEPAGGLRAARDRPERRQG